MVQIQITNISGGTYPIDVFISDVYGNNEYYLTGITSPVPPTVYYTTIIPSIFDTAPEILLKLVDADGCERFEKIPCSGPTPTPTPTITQTPTPTVTPGLSPNPTPTITSTPTPTPTPTVTPGLSPSPTPTATPTPIPSLIKVLLFMESTDDVQFAGNPNTDLGDYMVTNATSWYGFWTSGVAGINVTDLEIYMDWPGFKNGTTNVPAVIEIEIPQTSGGFDSYGNSIEAYKFYTTEVTANTTTGNVWYSIFAPPIKTNNKVYSSIGINYANAPTTLVNTSTEPTVYVYNIGYSGSNWINGTYKVYTQSAVGNGFNTGSVGVTDATNNYFRGGTLI
jgi:hypothetical protein